MRRREDILPICRRIELHGNVTIDYTPDGSRIESITVTSATLPGLVYQCIVPKVRRRKPTRRKTR